MQNTPSPSPPTPPDTDYSYLLTLRFRSQKPLIQIYFGDISAALLDQHFPPSDLRDRHRHLVPLQQDRGSAKRSQGPQDNRCLFCPIFDHINYFRWPRSPSALSQN